MDATTQAPIPAQTSAADTDWISADQVGAAFQLRGKLINSYRRRGLIPEKFWKRGKRRSTTYRPDVIPYLEKAFMEYHARKKYRSN